MSGGALLIWVVNFTAYMVWLFASLAASIGSMLDPDSDRVQRVRTLRAEMRPFALPCLLISYAAMAFGGDGLGFWGYGGLAMNLYNWWYWYHHDKDDDDRWKRRRKKLADKVAEVGGKLQVVPAGAR